MQDIFLLLVGFLALGREIPLIPLIPDSALMYDRRPCRHCLILDKDEQKRGIEILGRRQADVQTADDVIQLWK